MSPLNQPPRFTPLMRDWKAVSITRWEDLAIAERAADAKRERR
jgi:hypothetical protein